MGREVSRCLPRIGRAEFLATGAPLLVVAAATFRPIVQGDGVGYFSYLHAVLVDRSLDLTHAYAAATAAGVNSDPLGLEAPTVTGLAANYFPVGSAILAAPAYLGALALGGVGQVDYSPLLVGAFTLSSLGCGLLALLLCWRLTGSALPMVAVALGTPLTYYLLSEPSYSHTFGAFAVSLFVLAWWRGRHERGAWGWLWLGVLAGLMGLVRWQDATLSAIALLTPPARGRWRVLLMVPGALLAIWPQLVVDHVIFGTWWPQRPPGQELHLLSANQLLVLFSSWHGLFSWHPLTLAAAAGFLLVRDRTLRVACLYALLSQTLINSAVFDWWGSAAFGARRFTDLAVFWAIGLATLAERLPRTLTRVSVAVAAAWNVLLIANLDYVIRGAGDPGYPGLLAGQVAALPYVPHVLARGAVVRDLLLTRPAGLAWLAAEAACVLAVASLATWAGRWGRAAQSAASSRSTEWDSVEAELHPSAYRRVREAVDRLVAVVVGLLLLLPAVLIAIAIRLDSPGPVLFRQLRGGYLGRPFTIVKFRTMQVDAPHSSPKVHESDPRITRVGRFLRRSGLDELPQLWNVVRGDMALIGPRPEQYELLGAYEPWQHERHLIKPGLTGWWQVNHRDTSAMRLDVEKDVYYVRHQGPRLDALILWRTLRILVLALLPRGAGGADSPPLSDETPLPAGPGADSTVPAAQERVASDVP
jgi:lipopolysaccharide/colanic/teichoic acid biosynthesis glycosyltransferase